MCVPAHWSCYKVLKNKGALWKWKFRARGEKEGGLSEEHYCCFQFFYEFQFAGR